MVAHQAVGMQPEMAAGDDTLQHTQEPPPVLVDEEAIKAQRSGHAAESTPSICTAQNLTLLAVP